MSGGKYIGEELEIFAHARNWKKYYGSFLKPYFGRRVLEVDAGLGVTTSALYDSNVTEWTCLEPDPNFYKLLNQKIQSGELPSACRAIHGTLEHIPADDLYDAIIYIDVMEHIENDQAEAQSAALHLKPGGRLIVLSPAHQWLFTPFDQAIGHFRRYSRATLANIKPTGCIQERIMYLDSTGMLLSLANKLLLRQSMPTVGQILFWDRFIVPISTILDRMLIFNFGKSVVGVWKRIG